MIKYDTKRKQYQSEDGTVLHTGQNIEWNRKVSIEPIWFGAFNGKTPRDMFGSSDGTGYLKWMKSKGFNLSETILDTLEVGEFVHTDIPDFLVANNKPAYKSITNEITLGIFEDCMLGCNTFALFDQDLADTITEEGRSVLAEMVDRMAHQSRNIITANPEAGRNFAMIY